MKLLFCPVCHDVQGLVANEWRKCLCGESGGQYNRDLMTATLGGQARVFGVSNIFFDELYPYLTENDKATIRRKYNGQPTDAWWGEYQGDIQIFRIDSAEGPRLEVRVKRISSTKNLVKVIDKRHFIIAKNIAIRQVEVSANIHPALRQLLKKK